MIKQKEERQMPATKKQNEWIREHTITFSVKLNKNTDADIIKKLETVESRNGYIKELIRKDMAGVK